MNNQTVRQFKTRNDQVYEFSPAHDTKPKVVQVILNSQDRNQGTNAEASFNIALPTDFKTDKLKVCLNNFIPNYPTGTTNGIVNVKMVGIENPYSYDSSNGTTHRVLGTFILNEGKPREYPPAAMPTPTSALSNQSYGNGTYVAVVSSTSTGNASSCFNKVSTGFQFTTSFSASNNYRSNTGVYQGSNMTTVSGSNYYGEYVTLTMPQSVQLTSMTFSTNQEYWNRNVNTFCLGGSSNAGSNWDLINSTSNITWTNSNQSSNIPITSSNSYNTYRVVCTKVGNSASNAYRDGWGCGEIQYYGYANAQTTALDRSGQVKLNSEIVTVDKTLFNRPIVIKMDSPTAMDFSTLSNWTAQLTITEY
jgi:hypothetical protein